MSKFDDQYIDLLNTGRVYNPLDKNITIYMQMENFNFHLINTQSEDNFSDLVISKECQNKLRKHYEINDDEFFLIFNHYISQCKKWAK